MQSFWSDEAANGIRAAHAAGMRCGDPEPALSPPEEAVALADVVVDSLAALDISAVDPPVSRQSHA